MCLQARYLKLEETYQLLNAPEWYKFVTVISFFIYLSLCVYVHMCVMNTNN